MKKEGEKKWNRGGQAGEEKRRGKDLTNKKIVNLFLIVDHDFMDGWIRLALLPSVKHSLGRLELRLPVKHLLRNGKWRLICQYRTDSFKLLEKTDNFLDTEDSASSLISSASNKSYIHDNFEQFWQEVDSHAQKQNLIQILILS